MQWQKVVQNQYEIGKFCDQSGDSLNILNKFFVAIPRGYLSTIRICTRKGKKHSENDESNAKHTFETIHSLL